MSRGNQEQSEGRAQMIPQRAEKEGNQTQILHRPNRRQVLKTSAGTFTVLTGLSSASAAAADSHDDTDDLPAEVDDLFTALNCFEQIAGTAELALIVDFRREGIERLREETDDDAVLSLLEEAEDHNEMAADAVLRGRSDQVQEHLDQTSAALDQMDADGAMELINAQETPFETIFGGDIELDGEDDPLLEGLEDLLGPVEDRVPTSLKTVVRTFRSDDDADVVANLTEISRIEDPQVSRQVIFQTEIYLERAMDAITALRDNNYTFSFSDLTELTVSRGEGTSYSTSIGLSTWVWAMGYGIAQASVNMVLVGLGTASLFRILSPIGEATRILIRTLEDIVVIISPEQIEGLIRQIFPEQTDSFDVEGRLDGLIPLGLIVTHLLKARFSSVDEFINQLGVSDEAPVDDFESLLRQLATPWQLVVPLNRLQNVADTGIDLLTTPIEEIDEEINALIEQETGVNIQEEIDRISSFTRSLLIRTLNLEPIEELLPDQVHDYLVGVLEETNEANGTTEE